MKVSINLSEIPGSYTTNTNYRVSIDVGFVLDSVSKIPNAANPTLGSITSFNDLPITTIGYQSHPVVSNTTRTSTKAVTATNRAIVFEPVVPKTVNLYDVTTATAVLKASIPTTSTLVSYVGNNNINFDLYDYIYPNKSYRLDLPSGVCNDLMKFDSVTTSSNFTVGSYVSLPPTKYMTYPLPEFEVRTSPYWNRDITASDNYYAVLEEAVIVNGYTYIHRGRYHVYRTSDNSYVRKFDNTNTGTSTTILDGSAISNQYIALLYSTDLASEPAYRVDVKNIESGTLVRSFNITAENAYISGDKLLIPETGPNYTYFRTHVYSITSGSLLYTSNHGVVIGVSDNYALVTAQVTNNWLTQLINISNGSLIYNFTNGAAGSFGMDINRVASCDLTDSYTIINCTNRETGVLYAFVFSNTTGSKLYQKQYTSTTVVGYPYNMISRPGLYGVALDNDYFVIASLNGPYVQGGYLNMSNHVFNAAGYISVYSMSTGNLVAIIDNPVIDPNQQYPMLFGLQIFLSNKKMLATSDVDGNFTKRNLYSFNLNRLKA